MIDPYTAITAVSGIFNSGSGGSDSGSSSLSGGGNILGIVQGILKSFGLDCIGGSAIDERVLNEWKGYVEEHAKRFVRGIDIAETNIVFEDMYALIEVAKKMSNGSYNSCTTKNATQGLNMFKAALAQFEAMHVGTMVTKTVKGGTDYFTVPVFTATSRKSSTPVTDPNFPINGGVGQNEYVPNNSGVTYTQDEVDQMLKNQSFTSSLTGTDMTSLMSLKSQLQNNPNCRGGIKDGKVFLDCSVTNDHTQNVIQIAGLGLTAIGLVYMITSRKKKR